MGRGASNPAVRAVLDTSVLVRHFTHDDPVLGRRATDHLAQAGAGELLLTDVIVAETAVVPERYYRQDRITVTRAIRSLLAARQISAVNLSTTTRAADLYEMGSSFVDAHVVAVAEREGCAVASFDRRIARHSQVRRIEP